MLLSLSTSFISQTRQTPYNILKTAYSLSTTLAHHPPQHDNVCQSSKAEQINIAIVSKYNDNAYRMLAIYQLRNQRVGWNALSRWLLLFVL